MREGVQVFQVLWLWYVIPVRTTRPEEGGRGSGENQTSGVCDEMRWFAEVEGGGGMTLRRVASG